MRNDRIITTYMAMHRAMDLAWSGVGHTRPNPSVGAVVVKRGKIIGEGWHVRCGEDHAEVAALKNCRVSPKGATVYVTLEPCSTRGRVGACTKALIEAGVARVEWVMADPNPKNRGRAARILRRAGIECLCWETAYPEAWEVHHYDVDRVKMMLRPFTKHVLTGLPFVTVKLALSLDGKICDRRGNARWVSSKISRIETNELRNHVDVVMVGAETIRRDDPSLLSRVRPNDDLWRAVISRSGRLPKKAQVFTDAAKDRTLVYRDIDEAMRDLGRRGFMHVLCEGGLKLATSLAEAGMVDEWITVLSPKVIGNRPLDQATVFAPADKIVYMSAEGTTCYRYC